jgi:copper chaperone CopZ
MPTVTLVVPTLTSRQVVREVTSCLRDVPGVVTVAADVRTAVLTVDGDVDEPVILAELDRAGHPAGGSLGY